ncbi:hypothetical protein BDW02DRAFT_578223 [Decorospora gaudefroyi]|uniref:Nephrocystin 3-like N-terminal domain-containing protein n=1 Tax=Decorospora gaudefroyi TaxID=184978 RepID=A0A6A5KJQ9_9PLEO|nr:hypothetical protein BDW02DRAFT_578223 [Decorospora gaudefroyi]
MAAWWGVPLATYRYGVTPHMACKIYAVVTVHRSWCMRYVLQKEATGEPLQGYYESSEEYIGEFEEAVNDGLLWEGLRHKIEAIRKPLFETKFDVASYMELTGDGAGNFKDIVSRFYKKIHYCQRFSGKIVKLRVKVGVPLQDLHMNITITGLGNLRITQGMLEQSVAKSKLVHDEGLLHKVKEWLRPISAIGDTYVTTITRLLPGTCEWLFSKQEYVDWCNHLSRKSSPLLWISGIPGAGKTNLAAKVIQRLCQEKRTVAYFFCDGTAQRGDVRSILTTFCWELLNQFPEDVELLLKAYYKGGEPTETDMRECLNFMCERRNPVILLDGLDECTLHKRSTLCEFLVSSNSLYDVIIFSRELEDIEEALNRVPVGTGTAHISISESDTRKDLKRFIVQEAKRLGVSDEGTRQEIVRRLQVGCQGMFQWATQMIEHLMASQCMFDDEFLSKTEEMPKGLHDLARRALALPEIAMMLRVKIGARRHGKTTMVVPSGLRRAISDYCGSLVRFVQRGGRDVVILSHASVKEFLLGRIERERMTPMSPKEAEIEAELAEICLTYPCFDDIESPPFQITQQNESWSSLESKFADYLKRYPLMEYATTNAWYHASISAEAQSVQIAVRRFCSLDYITVRWLQAFLRLRGDRGIWRSNDAFYDLFLIEDACSIEHCPSELSRWLDHLQGSNQGRFSRWHRFVTSGSANDFLPALHVAAFFDFDEYVENELGKGKDPNEASLEGQKPLHLAARGDSVTCGKILLAHGADVNALGWSDTTPLSWAIDGDGYMGRSAEGSFEMAIFLLQHNADPNLGKRTARWACGLPHPENPNVLEIVKKMLDRGASRYIDGYPGLREPLLTSAVIAKSHGLIDLLLAQGANPNGRKEHSKYNHPLIDALRQSPSERVVEQLLSHGADPNAVRSLGAMKVLIAKHERHQLDTEDDLGRTPLMIAVRIDFKEGVQVLLDAGCSMESSLLQVKPVQRSSRQEEEAKDISYEVTEKQAYHFPRTKEDQDRVYAMLHGEAGRSRLPADVVRNIIDRAEYWPKSTSERCEILEYDAKEAERQVPYLLSDPIHGARHFHVRKIILVTRSHDQGWSNYKHQHGTYEGSMTFFDFVVQRPDGSIRDIGKEGRAIIHNVHGSRETREHFIVLKTLPAEEQTSWLELIEPGDRFGLVPQAVYQDWINFVESVRIEVFSTFIREHANGQDA